MGDTMTHRQLPVGHPARSAAATALWTSTAAGTAFTAFAYLTTQVRAVRAGSPWQDDPYDAVVTFTLFFVPLLGALGAGRMPLCRRDRPLPCHRVGQLLRTALVGTLLVGATLATDWAAVAVRADRGLWNGGTPWLIASLAVLTAVTALCLFLHRRAAGLLPATARPDGDWLDDVAPLVALLTHRHPRVGQGLARLTGLGGVPGFVRGRFTALAATAALAAGLLVAAGLASGEGWPGALLFAVEAAVFAGGTFAFLMICNGVLRIAAPGPVSGARRAARIAATAAASALPVALALRDPLWRLLGLGPRADSVGQWAVVMLAAALLTGVSAFGAAMVLLDRPARGRGGRAGTPNDAP
ncbi:hypothetical protein ACIBCA_22900 [Kitasatospora sp. NPDC051170]|uniref:hypothetical protein n=1 Tax=Kitasatospora sp. NPDC051170 TaxID=3364056 RepID=UPI0037B9D0E5